MTLDELRRLHEAATPGPWAHTMNANLGYGETGTQITTGDDTLILEAPSGTNSEGWGRAPTEADAILIATMRNMLFDLLACIEAADKLANLYHPADFADLAEAYRRARAKLDEVGA